MATISAFFAPAAADADAPPTTSVSAEIAENARGLVRSKTLAPPPRIPGRFAAVVPVSKLPLDSNSASDPLDAASRPHFVAPLGDDLSSHMSISSGRPSWQVPFTACTPTLVPSSVPADELSTASGPERLRMLVIFSGFPGHGTVVVVVPPAAFDEPPSSPLLPHAASKETSVTSTRMRTPRARGAATMFPPRSSGRPAPDRPSPRKKDYSRHHVGPDGPRARTPRQRVPER